MSIKKIKTALSDQSEDIKNDIISYVEGLQKKAENVEALTGEVNSLEGKLKESLETNKKIEEELKESLQKSINPEDGNKNETLLAEVENLRTQMQANESNYKESNNALIGQIRDLTVGSELTKKIANSGIIDDGMARTDVANAVKANMTYDENNNPIFLNEDGTTRFNNNGSAFGFDDAINEALEARPFLRDKSINGGGGSQGNTGGNPTLKRSEMTESQKGGYIKKHGQEAYFKLGA